MSTTPQSSGSNYEYVTARVRSRRAKLFDQDDYRSLTRMGPGEIARFMEESEFREEMNDLGARYSGVDLIEYALNRNRAKHYDDLLRWSEGSLYDYIARYLRRFDSWNAKTVLRGIYSDSDPETIEADLVPTGEFTDRRLDRLAQADSVEEVVELLDRTIFGPEVEAAYEEYEEEESLVPLENALDRAYYESLLEGLPNDPSRAVRQYIEFLEAEIDFRNIRNALRLARSGASIDPSEYFIEGGRLFSAGELDRLTANPDELVSRLRDSVYGERLSGPLDEVAQADSLIEFERALEEALLAYSRRLSRLDPLSVCPVFAYILAKEREVQNIRAIARGREAGLAADAIEEELIVL
jgi:V/A-type H+/Na+-transporting ATPase subunit C